MKPLSGENIEQQRESGRTILVVDDVEGIREMVCTYLTKRGHVIHTANDSVAALTVLDAEADISILITDISMPGEMDGLSLSKVATERKPDLCTIFMSGHSKYFDPSEENVLDGCNILRKPFRLSALAEAVDAAITS